MRVELLINGVEPGDEPLPDFHLDGWSPNPYMTQEEWDSIQETRDRWFREVYDKVFPHGASFMQASSYFGYDEVPDKPADVLWGRYCDASRAKKEKALAEMSEDDRSWFQ